MALLPFVVSAQLSGTYTINASGSGTTNYTSITAALTALSSSGVNGPVVFNIASGTYNEDIRLTSNPTGVSSTNTITFRGVGKYKVIIKDSYPLYLSNTDYIHVENVTLDGSTNGMYWYFSDYCKVTNCIVKANKVSTSSTYRGAYIYRCNYDTVRDTRIDGGYYGVYMYGTGTSFGSNENNAIVDCNIVSPYYYGIYHYYGWENTIEGNRIDSLRNSFTYRIRNYYCSRTNINRNQLYFNGGYPYGIYMYYESYYPTTSTNSSNVTNNFIGGTPSSYMYGIYATTNGRKINITNNTVIGSGSSSTRCLYISSGSGHKVKNNNFYQMSSSGGYAMYISSASYVDSLDYNNIYSANPSYYAYFAGARSSLTALKAYSTSYNQNTVANQVGFSDSRDYLAESTGLNNLGQGGLGITVDIEGNARPTSPDTKVDIGCNDFYLPANDAGIAGFPSAAFCAGTATAKAYLKNFGTSSLNSCTVNWAISIDGGSFSTQSSKSYSGTLGAGADSLFTLGTFTMAAGKTYRIKSWTTSPNSSSDPKNNNDTSSTTMAPALAGTFTVGGTGADFSTIGAAVQAMNATGICGPSTFRLSNSTFNEQVIIPEIAGASSTNTIRFVGGGWDKTTITHNGSNSSAYSTILLNGADYVTFDSVMVEASGASYGATVWFTNQADYNTVSNCYLLGDVNSLTTIRMNVVFSGSTSSYSTTGNQGNHDNLINNRIRGGYMGVAHYASTSSTPSTFNSGDYIENNHISNTGYGLYFRGVQDKKIIGNTIDTTTYYNMYNYYSLRDSIVQNKFVGNPSYNYTIYQFFSNYSGSSTSDSSYFINNMVTGGSTYGAYFYYNYRTVFLNNSFSSGSGRSVYFYYPYYSQFKNNSFENTGSGYAVYFNSTTNIANGAVNYNNYYAPSATNLAYFGGNRADFQAWQLAYPAHNGQSISANPQHNSTTDLRTLSPILNNKGKAMPQVPEDHEGDSRPASPDLVPDIGADEYYLPPYDLDVVSMSPSVFGSGNNSISMTIRNTGINAITSDTAYVSFARGNETPTVDSIFISSLAIGAEQTFTFNNTLSIVADTSFDFCVAIDGGITGDPDASDEYCQRACVGSSGTYSIDKTGNGDFKTFGEAVASISGCGISGTVTFEAEPGNYNEQVVIPEINGASASNQIIFTHSGSGGVTISNTGSNTTNWITVLLDGADYVTFEEINIEANGASYAAALFLTNRADNNTIRNCELHASTTATFSSYVVPLVMSAITTSPTSYGNTGNNNLFIGNLIRGGGYYGARINGQSGSGAYTVGNDLVDNEFYQQYYYPIYTYYAGFQKITGNVIDSVRYTSSGYGIYNGWGVGDSIANNKVNAPFYGIYNYYQNYYGTTSDTSYVVNNMITGGSNASSIGYHGYYADRVYVVGNSILNAGTSTSTSYGGMRLYYCDYNIIRNNSIYRSGAGYGLNYYYGTSPNLDYNNIYAPNSTNKIYYSGSNYTSVSAYATGASQGANSIEVDPEYVSSTDLHTTSLNLNNEGVNMPAFAIDFDGETRPLAPDLVTDIGSDEYYLPPYDADVIAIGTQRLTTGSNVISTTIKNNGVNTWGTDSIFIEYSIDGGTAVKDTVYTGTVGPNGTIVFDFTIPYTLSGSSPYREICIDFTKQFRQADPDALNEEYCDDACASGIASMTIDGSGGGDFLSFGEARDYLSCAGLTGPTTIRVMDGTYNESIELMSISGASATNTLRFVGESHDAKISYGYSGTFGDWTAIRLNRANHITFDSLTIENTDATYGWGVHFYNGSDSNTISNCIMTGSNTTTNSYNARVVSSNSMTGYSNGDNGDGNTIWNNTLTGGYYGVHMRGAGSTTQDEGNTISENTLRDQYFYAIYTYYQNDATINGNDVDDLRSTSGYSIYCNSGNRSTIASNKLQSGYYGIYHYYMNYYGTSSSDTSYIVNNMISNFGGTAQRGIYAYVSDRTKFLHNSVQTSHTSTTTSYASFYMYNSDNCAVMNNVFENTGGGITFYQSAGTLVNGWIDYNDYYAANSTYIAYMNGYRTTLSAWKSGVSTQNANSYESDPGFISSGDLHSFNDNVNNKANMFHSWSTDFDGDARPTSPDVVTDLGADDFWIPLYDADALSIETPGLVTLGNNTITAKIQNRGLRNLTGETAVVSYTINGGTPEYDTIAFKFIPVGDDTTYVFNSPWNNTGSGNYDICVGVDTIFGRSSDARDEICVSKCTGVADTIRVNPAGGADYTSITAAVARLSCGIVGPTVVYVEDGSYNEAVTLGGFSGSSSTNTIQFIGESVDGVVWNNASAYATVTLNGASNVSFENMTVMNTNTNNANGVVFLMTNATNNIAITECDIYASSSSTTSGTACIVASSNASLLGYQGQTNAYDIEISNNLISGGYYGIFAIGRSSSIPDSNYTITDNEFFHQYYSGMYNYNTENLEFSNNVIDSMRYSFGYAMRNYYSQSSRIFNNDIKSIGYGIYNYFDNYYGSTSDTTWVYNNTVTLTNNNGNGYPALYNYYANRNMAYHNTLVTTTTGTGTFGSPAYYSGPCTGSEAKNNIFYASNGGSLFYNGSSGMNNGAIDHNNYFSTGNFSVYHLGFYTSLSSLQSGQSNFNQNSVSVDPYFNSMTDLHAGAWQLMGTGDEVGIAEDFDGESRNLKNPDIGADEISKDVSVVSVLSPVNDCRSTGYTDSVTIRIQSVGVSAFTPGDSLYVSFMEGATMSTDTLVVPPGVVFRNGMSTDYTFRNDLTTGTAGAHSLNSWTDYMRDADMTNDTSMYSYFSNPNPSAAFTVAEKCEYETSAFTDGSSAAIGNVTRWAWDFGNGSTASSQNPSNAYGVFDTFAVELAISTDSGCVDTVWGTAITHPKPSAGFTTADVCDHSVAGFTNSSTVDHGSLTYSWDMGDNASTSTTTNPTLTYAGDGSYTVELIATSNKGCKDSSSTSIAVLPTPNPSFTATEECNADATEFTNNTSITSGTFSSTWDLDDGNNSSSSDPTHTYTNAGTYSVKLIETSTNGCKDSVTNAVTVNAIPVSSFAVTNMCFGDTLNPSNSSTGSNITYKWYLGNGTTSTQTNPAYIYPVSGTYTISQVVTSDKGCTDSSATSVSVATQPLSDFTFSNDCVHNSITFTNATSVACGTVSKYYWDYGDGTKETITSLTNPSHLYSTAGTYDVSLVIELANSTTDTATKSITIYAQPTADFSNTAACEGKVMQFTDATTAQSSTTLKGFSWTFGDGGSSNLKNPTNTYTSSNSYAVSMIVTDSRNCTDTMTQSLTISPNPSADFTIANNCAYDTVQFTNGSSINSGSISSFEWDFGNNTNGSTRHTGTVYGSAGFYTVEMVAISDKGCRDSISKTAQAFAVPTAGFNTSNVCYDENMVFTNNSSGGASYRWDFGNSSGASTASAPSYTYGAAGNYNVMLVATNSNSCNDTFSQQVSVYTLPTASFSTSDVCDGETARFSNTTTGGSSYSWSYGDGAGSSLTAPNHAYATSGSYNVQLIASSSNGCKDTTNSTLTVNANPSIKISTNDECVYDAVSMTNTTTGASTYTWSFGDGNTSTATSPSNNYATAGTYNAVLTATSSNNCESKDSVSVNVHASPSASFSSSIECAGEATDFSNSSSISSGTMSYAWDFGDNSGASNNVSPTYTYGSAKSYTVELIATSNNGCKDTTTSSAVVNALPTPAFSASNVCQGTSMNFTNSSSGSASYAWVFGDGNTSTATSPSNNYASSGIYTVSMTAKSSAGCEASESKAVSVYALPTASFTTGNECLGDAISTTNLSSGATAYAWTFGDGNSSTSNAPAHTYAAANTYTINLTATSSNNCTDQASRQVTIHSLPTAGFTAAAVCKGTATAFTNTTTNGNTYEWNFGDGGSSSLENPSRTYVSDGRYDVILKTTSTEGCIDADTTKVTVNEQPVSSFTASTNCSGDSTVFTNNSTGTILAHGWSFGDGNSASTPTAKHPYSTGGSYNARLQVTTAQGCSDQSTVAVTVYSAPTAVFTTTNSCLTDDATFDDNGSTGNGGTIADREWLFGDMNNAFGRSTSHKYDTAGIYTPSFVVTTVNGCSDTASGSIEIYATPKVSFTRNDTCEKTDIQFNNTSSISKGAIAGYEWNFNDGSVSTIMSPMHSFDTLGTYTVTLIATSDQNCMATTTGDVTVHPRPSASFVGSNICDGDSTRFQNHSSIADGNITYSWNLGDGNTSMDENPWHTYDTFGVYTVTMTVISDEACATEVSAPYEVYETPVATLPLLGSCAGASNVIPQTVLDLVRKEWSYKVYSGDGSAFDSVPNSFVYGAAGDYIASLSITTDNGCYDSTTTSVTVEESPTLNSFTYTRLANQEMEFTLDTDDTELTYNWDFGDGNTSTDEVGLNTYTSAGTYDVICTITNGAGCSDIITRSIEVFPTGISETSAAMNLTAYPNPFRDWVKLDYELTYDAYVRIELIDMQGRLISTLADGHQIKGDHYYEINENTLSTATGTMVVKVIVDDEVMLLNLMKLR